MTTPKLLVTDLDNTLYDWVTFFTRSFSAMVNALPKLLGVSEAQLLDEYKAVHTAYNLTELPFATLELPSVRRICAGMPTEQVMRELSDAFAAFDTTRDAALVLYPTVLETLTELQSRGIPVVVCTDSVAANARFRLKKLGLLPLFNAVYVLEGRLPAHPQGGAVVPTQDARFHTVGHDERKPDPRLLERICAHMGVAPPETVYIGDSLTRDVLMAHHAGAVPVWAHYGTLLDDEARSLLFRISHWTAAEVAREAELVKQVAGVPRELTAKQFGDVLTLF